MTAVLGSLLIGGLLIALLAWRHYGFGRGLVAVLYWMAARLMAIARGADQARWVYHEALRNPDKPDYYPRPWPPITAARDRDWLRNKPEEP